MAFELTCPKCDSELSMKRPPAPGKKITCPDCEHRFVPEKEPEEPPPKKKKRTRDDDDYAEDERQPKKKKKKQESSSAMLWILIGGGAGALLLIAGAVVVVILLLNKDKGSPSGSTASGGSSGSSGGAGGWSPDPKYKDKLGAAQPVLVKYQMDIPQGYQAANFGSLLMHLPNDPAWPDLDLNIDNTMFPETLEALKKKPGYEIEFHIDSVLKAKQYKNAKKESMEKGELAGGTFYRIRFTATSAQNKKTRGFTYVGICGKDYIFITCIADDPATDDTAKLLEAAVLTLRPGKGP
jgi:hypothetical protein